MIHLYAVQLLLPDPYASVELVKPEMHFSEIPSQGDILSFGEITSDGLRHPLFRITRRSFHLQDGQMVVATLDLELADAVGLEYRIPPPVPRRV